MVCVFSKRRATDLPVVVLLHRRLNVALDLAPAALQAPLSVHRQVGVLQRHGAQLEAARRVR